MTSTEVTEVEALRAEVAGLRAEVERLRMVAVQTAVRMYPAPGAAAGCAPMTYQVQIPAAGFQYQPAPYANACAGGYAGQVYTVLAG